MAMPAQIALLGDLYALAAKRLKTSTDELLQLVPPFGDESALVQPFLIFEEAVPPLSPSEQAAVFGAWIVRHKPFPRENREIGFKFMLLMLEQAEKPWLELPHDAFVVEEMLAAVESGATSLAKFVDWACLRVRVAEALEGEATA
jgi:hypothetical protein